MKDFEERIEHPSYGMLGFSRVTFGGKVHLFGSSIEHGETIRMRLCEGRVQRGLHRDWYGAGREIVEVEMSASQFADLITSLNQGDGVPVTIRRLNGVGIEEPPVNVSKRQQHLDEYTEALAEARERAKAACDLLQSAINSKKPMGMKQMAELKKALDSVSLSMGTNATFAAKSFEEQMDKTVTEAKAEVEAFIQNRLLSLAQQTLVENPDALIEGYKKSMPELGDGTEASD